MMKKKYLQPDSAETIAQEEFICASDLETKDSNGLEEWTTDDEGVWS